MTLRLYFDDDCAPRRLLLALRENGIDTVSSVEAGMFGSDDALHLDFATRDGRVLCSSNMGDFLALHAEWIGRAKSHPGMILSGSSGSPLASSFDGWCS